MRVMEKAIMLNFDFKKLNEVATTKVIRRAQATTMDKSDITMEDLN